jgi:hypothetical protein
VETASVRGFHEIRVGVWRFPAFGMKRSSELGCLLEEEKEDDVGFPGSTSFVRVLQRGGKAEER